MKQFRLLMVLSCGPLTWTPLWTYQGSCGCVHHRSFFKIISGFSGRVKAMHELWNEALSHRYLEDPLFFLVSPMPNRSWGYNVDDAKWPLAAQTDTKRICVRSEWVSVSANLLHILGFMNLLLKCTETRGKGRERLEGHNRTTLEFLLRSEISKRLSSTQTHSLY